MDGVAQGWSGGRSETSGVRERDRPAPDRSEDPYGQPRPGRRPGVRYPGRRTLGVVAAALVAFAAGVSADAFVLHVGQRGSAARVVIGEQVIRPGPPTSVAHRTHPPTTGQPAASLSWGAPVTVDTGFTLQSVSCPTAGFCAAVDSGGRVVVYLGGAWSGPVRVDPTAALDSVSCTGPQFCAAVDAAGNALLYNGSSWSRPVRVDRTPFAELTSVSCASSSFCAAVDGDGNALVFNGSSWSAPQQVDLQGWTPVSRDVATVSCPTPGSCVGVDPEDDAFYYAGGSWQTAVSIAPASSPPVVKYANAVSCASSTFCAAAQNPGQVVAYNGTQWSDPVEADPTNYLASLSCPSPMFCAAVDGLLPQGFNSGSATGRALLYNGIAWSSPEDIDGDGILQSISCPSAQFCMAVDQAGHAVIGTAGGR